MDQWVKFGELLRDLRSVKLSKKQRDWVNSVRASYEANGDVHLSIKTKMFALAKSYSRQLTELHESRRRARETNGRLAMGLSIEDVARRVKARQKQEEAKQNDLGF